MTTSEAWYILKQAEGHCEIVLAEPSEASDRPNHDKQSGQERWGPFASQGEAIAHRIGLIRSGKCQPI